MLTDKEYWADFAMKRHWKDGLTKAELAHYKKILAERDALNGKLTKLRDNAMDRLRAKA